jgi:hypothetical protein
MGRKIKYSFYDWCIDNDHNDWLNLWDYELNQCDPKDIPKQPRKKYWFKCPKGLHHSEAKSVDTMVRLGKLRCNGCNSFGQWLVDNIGEHAIEMYWSDKNTISPFDINHGTRKSVFLKCQFGHPDYQIMATQFTTGTRCQVCSGQVVLPDCNSIAITHPYLVKYFANKNDALTHTAYSTKRVNMRCPHCGFIKTMPIYNLTGARFSCPICSDGISFPNRFMTSVLQYLLSSKEIEFKPEESFDWSKNIIHSNNKLSGNKFYDFHIKTQSPIIVECHGEQHYNPNTRPQKRSRTLEEEQENDKIKKDLAINNGIDDERYIVLDCRVSSVSFIKKSIMNSNLPNLLCFKEDDVDWELCATRAYDSLVVTVCKMWDTGEYAINNIANIANVSRATVRKYLKRGAEIGLCNYGSYLQDEYKI